MPAGDDTADVPCYEDHAARVEGYERAEREAVPFLAVEGYEEGYTVTYDLLPTGYRLSRPARKELNERLVRQVERVVGDDSLPTVDVGTTVGESLGTVGPFDREATAREVATVVAQTVRDETNWVTAPPPDADADTGVRRN